MWRCLTWSDGGLEPQHGGDGRANEGEDGDDWYNGLDDRDERLNNRNDWLDDRDGRLNDGSDRDNGDGRNRRRERNSRHNRGDGRDSGDGVEYRRNGVRW